MPSLPPPPSDETEKMDNPWIETAARELHEVGKRWHLTSNRQLAQALAINPRTTAKLNPARPDGSLKLETIDRIYSTLTALCCLYFSAEEMEEEYRRLADSRMRIAQSVAPLPVAIQERLEEEKGYKKGECTCNGSSPHKSKNCL